MPLANIVGITGKKYSGKDTIGNILKKYGYVQLAFASSLKEACKAIFHFEDDQIHGENKDVIDEYWQTTPRSILQYVGTELFRDRLAILIPFIQKDIWVKSVEKQIIEMRKNNPDVKIVITDVRFQNECELISKYGGDMIRVNRQMLNNSDSHSSENQLNELTVNIEISNDGDIEELDRVILGIL